MGGIVDAVTSIFSGPKKAEVAPPPPMPTVDTAAQAADAANRKAAKSGANQAMGMQETVLTGGMGDTNLPNKKKVTLGE